MEWAWMPMAARMNEKATDLVYWVPPIYNSSLVHSSGCSSAPTSFRTSTRRSVNFRRASSVSQQPSIHRRKLASRRAKLRATESVLNDMEVDNSIDTPPPKTPEDKREALILDATSEEKSFEDRVSLDLPFPEVQRSKITKVPSLKEIKQVTSPSTVLTKQIPALRRTVQKITAMRNQSKMAPKPVKRQATKDKKKPKRPSMKIYPVPSHRSSIKRQKQLLDIQKSSVRSLAHGCFSTAGPLCLGSYPKKTSKMLPHIQCRMLFVLFSQFCEKKIAAQQSLIETLKSKLVQQEKVLKHTAELALDLKSHFININTRLISMENHNTRATRRDEGHHPYFPLQSVHEETTDESMASSVDESMSMHTSLRRASFKKRHMWPHRNMCISESMESADTLNDVPDVFRTSLRIQLSENGP